MEKEKDVLELCDQIRQVAFELHVYLRHGHLEKVYENGLAHRLRKAGFRIEQQHPLKVLDEDGTVLGYLRASSQHNALLINFGSPKIEIRKFIL